MIRYLTILLSLFLGLTSSHARTIKGTVCSAEDENIIVGAQVTALIDSLQTLSAITDNSGKFTLKITENSVRLSVIISVSGYEPHTISFSNLSQNIDLGRILLSPSASVLDEVTVSTSAGRVINLPDKSIIFPTRIEKERAFNPMNLLLQLSYSAPTLSVSGDGSSVKILDSTPQILINGIKRSTTDFNALNPMDILKVEYISYPDIRYGVPYINIVTIKNPTGASFMAAINAPVTTTQENHQLYASYRRGSNEVAVNYNGSYNKRRREFSDMSEQYFAPYLTYETELKGSPGHSTDRGQNVSVDYYLMGSPKKMLVTTASLSYNSGDHHSEKISTGLSEKYIRYNSNDNRSVTPSLNIYGTMPVTSAGKIEMNLSGSYGSGRYVSAMSQTNDYAQATKVNSDSYSLNGNLFYEHNLPWSKVAVSLSHRYTHASNLYKINADEQRNVLHQSRTTASATLSGQLRDIVYYYVSGGLYHSKVDKSQTTPYVNLFLRKPIKSLMLIYEFRTTTSFRNLDSYSDVIRPVNEILYVTGNMNMRSEVTLFNRIYAGYGYRKFFTNLNIAYSNYRNTVLNVCEYIDNPSDSLYGKFLQTTDNGKEAATLAADLTMSLNNLMNHYSIKLEASYRNMRSRGLGHMWRKACFNGGITASAYFGDWQFNAFANPFPSYNLYGNSLWMQKPYTVWGLGANWHKKAWSVGCQIKDLFIKKPNYQKTTIMAGDMITRHRYWLGDNSNWISFNVRYQISFGRQAQKAQRTLNGNTGVDTGVSL